MPATFRYFQQTDRPNKKGECPICLRITQNRKKKYFNTGIKIFPSDWNDEKEQVRRSHRSYRQLNDELDILLDDAKKAARLLRRENKSSSSAIMDRLKGATNENFFLLAENHLQDLERNKQFYLRKQTKATIKKLADFNGSKNLLFTEINSRYLTEFQNFMKNEYENKGSTIRKNMGDVRRIIKLAEDKQLIFNDPFEDVKPMAIKKPRYKPKLNLKQIQDLEKLSLPEDSMRWDARHSFAQYGAKKDISLYKMMILLGHQSVKTTENYLDTINVQIGNETLDEIF